MIRRDNISPNDFRWFEFSKIIWRPFFLRNAFDFMPGYDLSMFFWTLQKFTSFQTKHLAFGQKNRENSSRRLFQRHLKFHELNAGCWRHEFSIEKATLGLPPQYTSVYLLVFEKLLPFVNFVSVEKFQFKYETRSAWVLPDKNRRILPCKTNKHFCVKLHLNENR